MDEHAHRHDPDQIVRPASRAVRPRRAHGEPPAEGTGLVSRHAAPTAHVQQAGPSQGGGFWNSLTTVERAEFLATAREVVYHAGAVLWEEGDPADHTVVLKSGSVRVCVERDGRERIIATRGPGDIIGERAALMLRRRSATIVAMEPLHALCLTTQQFFTYLSNHRRVIAVMEREMYERLTEQSGFMHDPQFAEPGMEQYRAAHSYRAAVQYGTAQPYATVYLPIPPPGPYPPYAVHVANTMDRPYAPAIPYATSGAPGVSGPHTAISPRVDSNPYAPSSPYTASSPYAMSTPAISTPYVMSAPYAATGPQGAPEAYAAPGWHAASGGSSRFRAMAVSSTSAAEPSWTGRNCTVVYTDIAGFSSRVRGENDRIAVRRAMYAVLRKSFEESGVPWDACHLEDRGDGALIVIPPETPTAAVVDPMIALLGMRLRRHNHRSSEAVRIQLRIAVDVGPVASDPPGVSGWTIINAARLLDAAPLKKRLAATGADLGFIASRFVYDSVIAHSPGYVNADEYEPIGCKVKKMDVEGWIHLRGLPARSAT
ncbi:cyclic nucleotide-binding domain-containing protein [Actinomadura sp. GTD37]|uniref:cyclic nucleotide-binding domain-containing protein n=1 Tax=Actinomadura sp. GTD37 TaxID=1778030 RepID=UPI0035C01DCC